MTEVLTVKSAIYLGCSGDIGGRCLRLSEGQLLMWAMIEKFRMWLRSLGFFTSDIGKDSRYVHRYVHTAESVHRRPYGNKAGILPAMQGLFH